jgi:hypothetical protein
LLLPVLLSRVLPAGLKLDALLLLLPAAVLPSLLLLLLSLLVLPPPEMSPAVAVA